MMFNKCAIFTDRKNRSSTEKTLIYSIRMLAFAAAIDIATKIDAGRINFNPLACGKQSLL